MAADAITLISAACAVPAANHPLMPNIAPAQIAPIFILVLLRACLPRRHARLACRHQPRCGERRATLDANGIPRNALRRQHPGMMMNAPTKTSKLIKGATGDW